ncbi:rRNA-binding ribosome biosynthesis protein utp25 [Mycoemilia scoparia]|uniref:U3 small nucleolar RNA-associated protein 25 n=1 Tax=Mycoemilia scoparia TaxID=417184 RepID=A0A9W8A430_9FUNG|nr:rRNA-binding ribosome biosynthesis protein utp25 [Mycoemilia scoparia]
MNGYSSSRHTGSSSQHYSYRGSRDDSRERGHIERVNSSDIIRDKNDNSEIEIQNHKINDTNINDTNDNNELENLTDPLSISLNMDVICSMKATKLFNTLKGKATSIDFDKSGKRCVVTTGCESIHIFNCITGMPETMSYSKKYGCDLAIFTHEPGSILYGSTKIDDTIRYLSFKENRFIRYFQGHSGRVISISMVNSTPSIHDPRSQEGYGSQMYQHSSSGQHQNLQHRNMFVSSSLDGSVRVWDFAEQRPLAILRPKTQSRNNLQPDPGSGNTGYDTPYPVVASDPTGMVLAIGINRKEIQLYDMSKLKSMMYSFFYMARGNSGSRGRGGARRGLNSRQRRDLEEYGELDHSKSAARADNDLDSAISRAMSNKMSRNLARVDREARLKRTHGDDPSSGNKHIKPKKRARVEKAHESEDEQGQEEAYKHLLNSLKGSVPVEVESDSDGLSLDGVDNESDIQDSEDEVDEENELVEDSDGEPKDADNSGSGTSDEEEESENDDQQATEDDSNATGNPNDMFYKHFNSEDGHNQIHTRLKRVVNNDYIMAKPKITDKILKQAVFFNTNESDIIQESIAKPVDMTQMCVTQRLINSWNKLEKPYLNSDEESSHENEAAEEANTMSPLQSRLFHILNNYKDLFYTNRTYKTKKELMDLYTLHALNHVLRSRRLVGKNNAKLAKAQEAGKTIDEQRDQGFTRPKVLVMLPFRNCAFDFVQTLCKLLGTGKISKLERFAEEFGPGDEDQDSTGDPKKPEEFNSIFAGNLDDSFRVGIKVMPNAIQLYAPFYSSDIIIGSPLGLRLSSGSSAHGKSSKKQDFDFLSSIEVLIMDQCDAFLMQNWEHVKLVLDNINHIPKKARDADFSRIRPWCLDGTMKNYRQTLLFSDYIAPEFLSLFNNKPASSGSTDITVSIKGHHSASKSSQQLCMFTNYEGKVKVRQSYPGVIADVIPRITQIFTRLSIKDKKAVPEETFKYFIEKTLPSYSPQSSSNKCSVLVFIPSYLDYVKVRNYLLNNDYDFEEACEYSSPKEVSRARTQFYHGRTDFLITTERFHYFHRYKIRGIKKIVFYGLPEHSHYYSEYLNMTMSNASETNDGSGNSSVDVECSALFSTYDQLRFERIVGSKLAKQMLSGQKSQFTFT